MTPSPTPIIIYIIYIVVMALVSTIIRLISSGKREGGLSDEGAFAIGVFWPIVFVGGVTYVIAYALNEGFNYIVKKIKEHWIQ